MAEMIGAYDPDRDVMYWVHEQPDLHGLVFVKSDVEDIITVYTQKSMKSVAEIEHDVAGILTDYKAFRKRCMEWVLEFEDRIKECIVGVTIEE